MEGIYTKRCHFGQKSTNAFELDKNKGQIPLLDENIDIAFLRCRENFHVSFSRFNRCVLDKITQIMEYKNTLLFRIKRLVTLKYKILILWQSDQGERSSRIFIFPFQPPKATTCHSPLEHDATYRTVAYLYLFLFRMFFHFLFLRLV